MTASSDQRPPVRWYALHTVRSMEESVGSAASGLVGVEDVLVPVRTPAAKVPGGRNRLLFGNYVFVRASLTPALPERLAKLEHVLALVGTGGGASPVSDGEIELVRYLMTASPLDEIDPIPAGGLRAEILSGPLKGVEGRLIAVVNNQAKLVLTLSFVGKFFELLVPAESILIHPAPLEAPAEVPKKRHRGGRRARRSRKPMPPTP